MIFNAGFIYRLGISIKNVGERMVRVPIARLLCGPVISLGLVIKESVIVNRPIADFMGQK